MKRLIEYLPFIVLGVAACIVAAAILEFREKKKEDSTNIEQAKPMIATAPEGENHAPVDQALTREVFNDPSTLDSVPVSTTEAVVVHNTRESPALLTEGKVGGGDLPAAQIERIAVEGNELEAYASLRSDAVRVPESEQNRAAVESIMRKRQRRVEQFELD